MAAEMGGSGNVRTSGGNGKHALKEYKKDFDDNHDGKDRYKIRYKNHRVVSWTILDLLFHL